MTVEHEAKLIASSQLQLPDLDELIAGTSTVALAGRHLEAVYYDTVELDLARMGITLRHRSGEAGPPWTLKLPRARVGQSVTREELTFEGSPADVPIAACDLVSAFIRSRELVRVARLETKRSPVEIRDTGGQRLAEITDDRVVALCGRRRRNRFREVEVEVFAEGRVGQRLLASAVDRLVAAGCRQDTPLPKLVRALGARALGPPQLVVPSVGQKAPLRVLVQHALARSVLQMLRHDPGVRLGDDPEDVHQFRVGIRRLRSDLRTFEPVLRPGPVRKLRDELHWLGSAVGAVRDRDVLTQRLRVEAEGLPEEDDPGVQPLLSLLAREAESARATMLASLRSARYYALLDALVAVAREPPIWAARAKEANKPALRIANKFVRRPWRRLAEAVTSLDEDPSNTDLHTVRILAKRCRYAAEAVAPVLKPATRFAAALAEVQTVLGEHHDTVVAEAWLHEAAISQPESAVAAGELILLQRLDQARLRSAWPATWNAASTTKLCYWI